MRNPSTERHIPPNPAAWRTSPRQAACAFARRIIAERTGQPITLLSPAPDAVRRDPLGEECWTSPARRYVVGHAAVRAVETDGGDSKTFAGLASTLTRVLSGRVPGRFHLYLGDSIPSDWDSLASMRMAIERKVINAAPYMNVGEWRTIESRSVPFPIQLHRAHINGSRVLVGRRVDAVDARRLARAKNALAGACPSLARARAHVDAISVLILESSDDTRVNGSLIADAILLALSERQDQPDIVLLVETGLMPLHAWVVADRVDLYPPGRSLPRFYDQNGERA